MSVLSSATHTKLAGSPRRIMLRTCVGCRNTAHRNELVRVIAHADGSLELDVHASLPGRGAWVHPGPDCIAQAIKTAQFSRAFRRPITDTDALVACVSDSVQLARLRAHNPMKAGREPMGTR